MGLRPVEIFEFLQCGDRLWSSESDVYIRQILTTEVESRAARVNAQPSSATLEQHQPLCCRDRICDPSARNESHVGSIQVEKMSNMHDMG